MVAERACAVLPDLEVVYVTGGPPDYMEAKGVPGGVLLEQPFRRNELMAVPGTLLELSGLSVQSGGLLTRSEQRRQAAVRVS